MATPVVLFTPLVSSYSNRSLAPAVVSGWNRRARRELTRCNTLLSDVRTAFSAKPCARVAFRTSEELHVKRHLKGLVKRGLRQAASEREHPLEQIVLRSAGLNRQPTDAQIDDVAAAVARALNPLLGVAMSGNVHGIRKVLELASVLCAEATSLACMHQTTADIVAHERTTWPLNISHDAKERRRTLRLITGPRRLPLGKPSPQPIAPRKTTGFSNPASAAVLVALKAIEIERSFRIPSELFPSLQPKWSAAAVSLPDLEPSTAGAWFNVIWMYICDRNAGAPEKSELRRLAETHQPPSDSDTPRNVRANLREALEKTFLRLAQGRGHRRRTASRAQR